MTVFRSNKQIYVQLIDDLESQFFCNGNIGLSLLMEL